MGSPELGTLSSVRSSHDLQRSLARSLHAPSHTAPILSWTSFLRWNIVQAHRQQSTCALLVVRGLAGTFT